MNEIHTYTYACSVCKNIFMWAEPEPKHGKTCPDCRDSMKDKMIAWGEEQGKEEEVLIQKMNNWWDELPKDVQEKAFFCVVKRITDAELIDNKTYRQIMLDDFGFDNKSYYMGVICGFMALHNSIVPPVELSEMRQALRERKKDELV